MLYKTVFTAILLISFIFAEEKVIKGRRVLSGWDNGNDIANNVGPYGDNNPGWNKFRGGSNAGYGYDNNGPKSGGWSANDNKKKNVDYNNNYSGAGLGYGKGTEQGYEQGYGNKRAVWGATRKNNYNIWYTTSPPPVGWKPTTTYYKKKTTTYPPVKWDTTTTYPPVKWTTTTYPPVKWTTTTTYPPVKWDNNDGGYIGKGWSNKKGRKGGKGKYGGYGGYGGPNYNYRPSGFGWDNNYAGSGLYGPGYGKGYGNGKVKGWAANAVTKNAGPGWNNYGDGRPVIPGYNNDVTNDVQKYDGQFGWNNDNKYYYSNNNYAGSGLYGGWNNQGKGKGK